MINRPLLRLAVVLGPLVAMAACGPPAIGNYFAPTAAVINGHKIAESKISEELRRALLDPSAASRFRGPQGPQNRVDAQREILNRLVKQEVIFEEAKTRHLSASALEVDQQLEQLKTQFGGQAGLVKTAKKEGFTIPEVRSFLKDRVVLKKVVDEVTKDSQPSEQKLKDFYDQNQTQGLNFAEQVHAAHILICESFDAAAKKCNISANDESVAKSVTSRARAGEDFAALAKEFSKDPSNKDQGGDLGYFGKGRMAAEFEQAAFALTAPGQISDPVKTTFGFHVIKLLAKGKSFEDAKAEILQTLGQNQQQQAFQQWLEDQLGRAKIVVSPKFGRFDRASGSIVAKQLKVNSTIPRLRPGGRPGAPPGGP